MCSLIEIGIHTDGKVMLDMVIPILQYPEDQELENREPDRKSLEILQLMERVLLLFLTCTVYSVMKTFFLNIEMI